MNPIRRPRPVLAVALGALAATAVAGAPPADAATVPPTPVGVGLARGSDGSMWFTANRNRIGRASPRGAVGAFRARASGAPFDLVIGHDGNGWFSIPATDRMGRITPAGVLREFALPRTPAELAIAPGGDLWFTTYDTPDIGSMTPSGTVTIHPTGLPDGTFTRSIVRGPDGAMWFTSSEGSDGTHRLNRMSLAGVTTLGVLVSDRALGSLTRDAHGNLWLTQPDDGRVARITPDGSVSRFVAPVGVDLAGGADGNVWFTSVGAGRITPFGAITLFRNGFVDPPVALAHGPGGMWFTDAGGRLGRITPTGRVSLFPATPRVLSTRQPERGAITVRLRCSAGNITPCRGVLVLGQSGRGGRTAFAVAPGATREVRIAFSPFMRSLLAGRRRLEVTLLLRPVPDSLIGGRAYRVTLRG